MCIYPTELGIYWLLVGYSLTFRVLPDAEGEQGAPGLLRGDDTERDRRPPGGGRAVLQGRSARGSKQATVQHHREYNNNNNSKSVLNAGYFSGQNLAKLFEQSGGKKYIIR